jgi:hypothetical protein
VKSDSLTGSLSGLSIPVFLKNPPNTVGVPAVVSNHLKAFFRNVLRDRGDELLGAKHFEVPLVRPMLHEGPVNHLTCDIVERHLLKRKGIAHDVLRQGLLCFSVIGSYPVPAVDTEAGVPPAHELADLPVVYLSFTPEQVKYLGPEHFLQVLGARLRQNVECSVIRKSPSATIA